MVERSGYLKMAILAAVSAGNTAKAIVRLLAPIRGAVKTITFDNGPEFAAHEMVSKALTAKAFFCAPLYVVSTRHQREYKWPDPAVFSEGHRLC
jgi:IS30 family transposase